MRRDVFQAISDPVRRDIIQLLSKQPLSVNVIAENFMISRPAISKHLKILKECGVITISKQGRQQFCYIQPRSLLPAFLWIEQYQHIWEERIDSFEDYLLNLQHKKQKDE
ncbi:ArsR/SmtB family transcription factor [Aquimarina hainanensis]|uniref:ArsR/SmtB family transcription factor n=1 Tax=Aquimarina hainanensis TaxID=1578017 RepID=A0ABW5NBF6_9FLAO|nr:metalloregulator ArsR/SmtB family transcription factor [Aquimarina sp. TRL1]QKX06595.1 winged helix-turn-helix transcriptional regulator [Aquimarina sp. TRL1]